MKRILSLLVVFVFCFGNMFSVCAEQENLSSQSDLIKKSTNENTELSYYSYNKNSTLSSAEKSVSVYNGEDITLSENGRVDFTFTSEKSFKYNIKLVYDASKTKSDVVVSVLIDNAQPFEEAEDIKLPVIWVNSGDVIKDIAGNESAQGQIKWAGNISHLLNDSEGIELSPFEFNITEGQHTFTLLLKSGNIDLKAVSLEPIESIPSYEEYLSIDKNAESVKTQKLVVEGEDAVFKSDKSLIAKSDNSDPSLNPSSASKKILNTIGFNSWNSPNESLTWKIDVKKSGFYKLGFKFKQSESLNNNSYRRILIDGKVPFKEANEVAFRYGNSWQFMHFSNDKDEPYLFYLKKGEHTLTMTSTLASSADYYRQLEEIVNDLGDIYINISMITGESPDKNRDYDLFRQIPDLNDKLNDNYKLITSLSEKMNRSTDMQGSSMIAALKNMSRVLKSMIDNPYTAQRYLSDYYTNYTSVGGWLYDMKAMPLSLDRIILSSEDEKIDGVNAGFFSKIFFSIKRFVYSFSNEYNSLGTFGDDKPTVKIWVNWGRDQAEILGNMINDDFTPNHGINVELEIVNAGIVKGILAGNPPDLSLHMARSEPVNLAMRDALVDLSKFEDFEEINNRFAKTAYIPYVYNGGVYALPDTQSFYIMYCRTDILEKLKVNIPKTWDEFIDAAVTIQRNNMQVWLPYLKITTATTVNTGVGGLSMFPTFVHQHNMRMYNSELNACTLSDESILPIFKMWTDFYTKYKLPKEVSFYNRFRIGTIPLGIEQYTMYQTIVNAAPEISDDWTVAEIPGIMDENGNINNAVAGSGTGCGIIKDTGNEEYAWEFLKWWTSKETQLKYSESVETILGTLGRVASANIDAVSEMSWKKQDLEIILSAWDKLEEVEEIPGSYYLTRAVDQAYWAVVNGKSSPKEALITWGEFADNEIERKIEEYS